MVDRPDEIASRVNQAGTKVVLVLGLTVWETNSRRWRDCEGFERERESASHCVYPCISWPSHRRNPKIGPRLYFTNRIDLFSEVRFDQVVYCGSTDVHSQVHSDQYWVDSLSYHEQLNSLLTQISNLQVLDRIGVTQTVSHLCSSVHALTEITTE